MKKDNLGFELGEILSDFEQDKNEVKAVESIIDLIKQERQQEKKEILKLLEKRFLGEYKRSDVKEGDIKFTLGYYDIIVNQIKDL